MATYDLSAEKTNREQVVPEADVKPFSEPLMVWVMSKGERKIYYALVALWVVTIANYWWWWFKPEHIISWYGICFNSMLLAWSMILPAYFYAFAGRMKKPNPNFQIGPDKRVAMVVTKAPSEPWDILETTLYAMKHQDYPYAYDVWLADERPSPETVEWCNLNDVHISTRHNFNVFEVEGYQNLEFPRRTKSKEGNLSYFYDTHAEKYDFVAQLDADHVPTPSYLSEMMRPFVDPRVGYVAAPSICDANVGESWVVNARLFAEASMHGALQAGYNESWAPMAIGSHYAVRVEAVQNLLHVKPESFWGGDNIVIHGGIGPELAEDHSTSLAMNARGYKGAFALEAVAHGDGAASFADSITQEMQWSRSLMTLLLRWTSSYFKHGVMPFRLKAEFMFAQLWYPIFAFHMLISYQMSNLALILRQPWVDINYPVFLVYFAPTVVAGVLPIVWLKRMGTLRPRDAKVSSWEQILFVYVRWPWALQGVIQSIIGSVFLNRELNFKVTPKGATGARELPVSTLMPYFLLVVIATTVVLLVANPGNAQGYYFLSLGNALEYTITISAVIYLHYRENRAKIIGSPIVFLWKPLALAAICLILLVAAAALRGPRAIDAILFYGAG